MRSFRDIPINQKLVIVTMATTAAALLVAGSGIVLADALLFRTFLRRDLAVLARIVADNSTGALAFNDPDIAAETLGALRARTHVKGACMYRMDGSVLATYAREGTYTCPAPDTQPAVRFSGSDLIVWQPVMRKGGRVGTLMLLYDLGEANERIKLYGAAVLGVLLAASLLAFVLSSRLRSVISDPISQLVGATTSVSQSGDYGIRAQKFSGDELGVLVDRFNEMLAGIQSRDNDLKQALVERGVALREAEQERERFHFMAESAPQKIFTAKPDGEVDYFNRQWMEYTGLSFDEIKGWGWTQFIHPGDVEANIQTWRHSVETGEPFLFEHRFRRADGKYHWHLSRAHAMRDAHENITMWIGSNTDIHDQKEKEEELRRANDDLQQFAYSASHDLQEPIRNVAIYSEIVARRYHALLDDDGRQYLEFLREGGRRLATLVNDLLAYTRATVVEPAEKPVKASAALEKSIAGLQEAIRESSANVTRDPLPDVYMSDAHLQQIFQNLIGNALKYRNEQAPQIHISAVERDGYWRFSVKDNGIGIDPEYKEKIFGVFKRLHHDRKYSGTGIGLAICLRVVERYGGRIWVESEPGQGATFYFTVPRLAQAVRPAAPQPPAG
jgi:PAS domain S-box-containing protein